MPRPCWRARFRPLDGVAQVSVFGSAKYAVRIQADPDALAARQIGIDTAGDCRQPPPMSTGHRRAQRRRRRPPSSTPTASSTMPPSSATRSSPIATARRCGWAMSPMSSTALENPLRRQLVQRHSAPSRWRFSRQPGSNTIERDRRDQDASCRSSRPACPPAVKLEVMYDRSQSSAPRSTTCRDAADRRRAGGGRDLRLPAQLSATIIPSLALPIAVIGTFAGMALWATAWTICR